MQLLKYCDEILHSYTSPKEDQNIFEPRDTPYAFCWRQHFSPEIHNFCYDGKSK